MKRLPRQVYVSRGSLGGMKPWLNVTETPEELGERDKTVIVGRYVLERELEVVANTVVYKRNSK